MNITRVETFHLALPPARTRVPLTEPTPGPTSVVVVRLHTETAHVGLGFTTAPAAGRALPPLIEAEFAPLVTGEDPMASDSLFARAQGRFRATGWGGLVARAYAAIDIAIWDLKAKAAG